MAWKVIPGESISSRSGGGRKVVRIGFLSHAQTIRVVQRRAIRLRESLLPLNLCKLAPFIPSKTT